MTLQSWRAKEVDWQVHAGYNQSMREENEGDSEAKIPPWLIIPSDRDRTIGQLRELVPWVDELRLWGLPVAKCWAYHPRLAHALLAAQARRGEVDHGKGASGALTFYVRDLRDLGELLGHTTTEPTHLLSAAPGAEEVLTIDDLEKFLASKHFTELYGSGAEVPE